MQKSFFFFPIFPEDSSMIHILSQRQKEVCSQFQRKDLLDILLETFFRTTFGFTN